MEPKKQKPKEKVVKKPTVKPDTGGGDGHGCPQGEVWSEELQKCIPDLG